MPDPDEPAPAEKGSRGRDVALRVVTGLFLAGVVFGTLFTSRIAWMITVTSVVLFAQWELYRALGQTRAKPAVGLGIAAGGVLLVGSYQRGAIALASGLTMSIAATFGWFLADPKRSDVAERIGMTILGLVYVPFLGAHVILMRDLPSGPAVTVAYVGLVAFYDIGAYAGGSMFGKRLIAPTVSPKKTLEGAGIATFVIVVLALSIGPFLGPFTAPTALGLALITAVTAPVGDLAESLLKRDLGVKDMGTILPGHGGLLDRIDALLFVAPAAYWYLRLVL